MRVPTSVLLAVLTAAGLLALAPALVRRYDATERLVAERALSTARVIDRRRRRRTVPGRRPINPPRFLTLAAAAAPTPAFPVSAVPLTFRAGPRRPRHTPAVYPRRRVLAALVMLNVSELVGLLVVGPGFSVGCAFSGVLLVGHAVHLRRRAVVDQRRRRAAAPR